MSGVFVNDPALRDAPRRSFARARGVPGGCGADPSCVCQAVGPVSLYTPSGVQHNHPSSMQ